MMTLSTIRGARLSSAIVLLAIAAGGPWDFAAEAGPIPSFQRNPKSYQLFQAYRRSEVLLRERYGQPVPWKYILLRPDGFDPETVKLAHVAQHMDGARYRDETDFTNIIEKRIPFWRERARTNRRALNPEAVSHAQAELAREITRYFLDKIDKDYTRSGRIGATIDDALLLVRTLDEPGFFMVPTERKYGPEVSALRAQAIIADAYFSHAGLFTVDPGFGPGQVVEKGAELAALVRINEFDRDHPLWLRYRYLRGLTRQLDGSASGNRITDAEIDARIAFLQSVDTLERNPSAIPPLIFVLNEDTVDYVKTVASRLSSGQLLRILGAVPSAGRPPAEMEGGIAMVDALDQMARRYLDTVSSPLLVSATHIPAVVSYLDDSASGKNRALLAWAQANRRNQSIPSSLIQSVRDAENATATRAALSALSESELPEPKRSLPRLRLYDNLLR